MCTIERIESTVQAENKTGRDDDRSSPNLSVREKKDPDTGAEENIMDTRMDRAAGSAEGTSIRLHYSRQFQSSGHTHTIDAEALLPVGANQEKREQVIRELESGVDQLARQIAQRASRPMGEARTQVPRPAASSSPITREMEETGQAGQRPHTGSATPAARTPVSESMPTTISTSSESNPVRLPQFINAIKKRWNMSLKEAMDLLNVTTLDGTNLREVYAHLQTIVEAPNASGSRPPVQPRISHTPPVVEAPRQANRTSPPPSSARPPVNQASTTLPGTRPQGGKTAVKDVMRSPSSAVPIPEAPPANASSRLEEGRDFAGSARAPIPIQLGTVRDLSPQSYKFAEEEDEEDGGSYGLPANESTINLRAQQKLNDLTGTRGNNAVSVERLTVLNNVIDSQISDEQLQKLIQNLWGISTKKKLKAQQVEKLISWAKEDFFAEEVEAVLELFEERNE